VTEKGAAAEDRRDIRWAVSQARKRWKGPGREVLNFVESALTADLAQPRSGYGRNAVLRFAMKFQQYSGPVAAKGIEDTAFYRYHRLVSLNEVGGDPRQFGLTPAAFHHQNQERARLWPHGMLATATHDTKRGEDTRARLNALSEMPAAWGRRAARWASLNRRKKREIDGRAAPGRNDEYLLYQTMLGAWPVELASPEPDETLLGQFAGRLKAYMQKAAREAKERSSWQNPDTEYEAALEGFIERILDPRAARPFLQDFLAFQPRVATLGMLNGLAQTALKLTSPGVPDIYQGSELWDLSLVDPDNRRPVDFARRAQLLQEAIAALPEGRRSEALRQGRDNWHDGRIKLYLIHRLLSLRRDRPALFEAGAYAPLEAEGGRAEHMFAFSRSREGQSVIVAVGRLFAALLPQEGVFPAPEAWQGTKLCLPQDGARSYRDILTGRQLEPEAGGISASRLFEILPAAVLLSDD
jgi:(1->4)-alpha-D-glucan 1-alpha-D-glucosylmutase